jgi:hypothetical protein
MNYEEYANALARRKDLYAEIREVENDIVRAGLVAIRELLNCYDIEYDEDNQIFEAYAEVSGARFHYLHEANQESITIRANGDSRNAAYAQIPLELLCSAINRQRKVEEAKAARLAKKAEAAIEDTVNLETERQRLLARIREIEVELVEKDRKVEGGK